FAGIENLIMKVRTKYAAAALTRTNVNRLDGVDGNDGLSEQSIQFPVPSCVRAESWKNPLGPYLKTPTDRISAHMSGFDNLHHPPLSRSIYATQFDVVTSSLNILEPIVQALWQTHFADRHRMAGNLDTETEQ